MYPISVCYHLRLYVSSNEIECLFGRDEELMVRIGAVTALEARATGVHYAFAPCIAVRSSTLVVGHNQSQSMKRLKILVGNGD